MAFLVSVCLIMAGIIHLLPLPGLLGADWLARLYGIRIDDPNMLIMMRHRALLFGVVGALLVAAAFRPDWQPLAVVAGLVSAAGFLVIAWQVGGSSPAVARVVTADIVAVAALVVAGSILAFR